MIISLSWLLPEPSSDKESTGELKIRDSTTNLFLSPSNTGANGVNNPVWTIGTQQTLKWKTNITSLNLLLYQQQNPCTNANCANGPDAIQYDIPSTVTEYAFILNDSYPNLDTAIGNFFFVGQDSKDANNAFGSSYLNFTTSSSITPSTTTSSSNAASTVTIAGPTVTAPGSASMLTTTLPASTPSSTLTSTTPLFTPTPTPPTLTNPAKVGISFSILTVLFFIFAYGYFLHTHKTSPFSLVLAHIKRPPRPPPSSPPPPIEGPAELPGSRWSQRRWGGIPKERLEMDGEWYLPEIGEGMEGGKWELDGKVVLGEMDAGGKGEVGELDGGRGSRWRWENYKGRVVEMSGIFELDSGWSGDITEEKREAVKEGLGAVEDGEEEEEEENNSGWI